MEILLQTIKAVVKGINDNQGVLSFLFSLLGVILAICIPATIARNQNKIALITRRYELFSILSFLQRLATESTGLDVDNKSGWELKHLAKCYFMVWLMNSDNISIKYPQLAVNFKAIQENGRCFGWRMIPPNGYSLSSVKIAFLQACASHNCMLEERKMLFDTRTRNQISKVQEVYASLYTSIAITADFSEDTQNNYEAEPLEGVFDRIGSVGGGLEASRRAFLDALKQADEEGLFVTIRKLSSF